MNSNRQFLAKIWRPVHKKFTDAVERACLRRDAYLDHVLAHEARALKEEILQPNSRKAKNYLQGKLEELDRVPVNFSLSTSTIDAINEACGQLNIIRDCFVNRVLFLLASDINKLDLLLGLGFRERLPEVLGEHDRDFLYAPLWDGSLCAISEIARSDPFWALRNLIEHSLERGDDFVQRLHCCLIRPELFSNRPPAVIALNCCLPDEYIPGSAEAKRAEEQLNDLLGELNPSAARSNIGSQKPKGRRKND